MTPKQKCCRDAIRLLTIDGVVPSYDEIKDHLGLTSKGEVFRMVTALVREGWLAKGLGARSLILTTPEPLDSMSPKALRALRTEIDRRLAA